MKREFNPVSPRARLLCAATAAVATTGIVASVLALAKHYDVEFLQVARAQSTVAMARP